MGWVQLPMSLAPRRLTPGAWNRFLSGWAASAKRITQRGQRRGDAEPVGVGHRWGGPGPGGIEAEKLGWWVPPQVPGSRIPNPDPPDALRLAPMPVN